MNHPAINFIPPQIFRLLTKIKNQITSDRPVNELTNDELVDLITDEIKKKGDALELPIFRIKNKFIIYENWHPIHEKFLLHVGDHLGIDKEILTSISFRNQCFGKL